MAPVAHALAGSFRVIEPMQRGSGQEPLTVARHVEDLHHLLERATGEAGAALVGHSWGAMLALAHAAAHPDRAKAIVLIGCGTFDPVARRRMHAIRDERMDGGLKQHVERLRNEIADPDERLRALGNLLLSPYSHDPVAGDLGAGDCDARASRESWDDMVRLQEEGVYPAAFAAIGAPVLMLHGSVDPHPGGMIRASLAPHLPGMEYEELASCGHYPWLERAARDLFFASLIDWLGRHLPDR
jgi:pimeloyl-ACP methyl ester carboxylesterase